jgi:CAAX protease family protein
MALASRARKERLGHAGRVFRARVALAVGTLAGAIALLVTLVFLGGVIQRIEGRPRPRAQALIGEVIIILAMASAAVLLRRYARSPRGAAISGRASTVAAHNADSTTLTASQPTAHHRRKRKRRPPPPASRASEWTVRYALSAYVVVLVIGVVLVSAFTDGELRLGLGVILVDATMLATLVPLRRRGALTARDLGLRRTSPARSVGLVAVSLFAVGAIEAIWSRGILQQPVTPLVVTLHESTAAKILGGFAAALSAPVCEEIFFRGLLYRSLRNRMRVGGAALLAGALFAIVHATTYPLDSLPPKLAFGVIACLLYEYTGSLYPGIALHSLIDASGFEARITGHTAVVLDAFLVLGVALLVYAGTRRRWPLSQGRRLRTSA